MKKKVDRDRQAGSIAKALLQGDGQTEKERRDSQKERSNPLEMRRGRRSRMAKKKTKNKTKQNKNKNKNKQTNKQTCAEDNNLRKKRKGRENERHFCLSRSLARARARPTGVLASGRLL